MTLYSSAEYGIGAGYDICDLVDDLPEDMKADILKNYQDSLITYEDKQYYAGRGSGENLASLEEDGTTVTLTDTDGAKLVLIRTAENTMTVQSFDNSFAFLDYLDEGVKIPVGAVFAFKAD